MPPEMILMILSFCHDTTLCELEDSIGWIDFYKDIRKIKHKKNRLNCDNLGSVCPWCSKLYCDLCRKVCDHPKKSSNVARGSEDQPTASRIGSRGSMKVLLNIKS